MRKEYLYYDIYPLVVRAGQPATITIHPRFDHVRFGEGPVTVRIVPAAGRPGATVHPAGAAVAVTPENGDLRAPFTFEGEGEYVLLVEARSGERGTVTEARLYALDADLFERRPYRGDMHMHSFRSDGWESPAYVAGACRRTGLDFMALTDHRQYAPSLEASAAYRDVAHDLAIYPGEEVHPPDNPVHIVNFGGSFSVNALFETEDYRRGVEAIAAGLGDLPVGAERYPCASCAWCFDRIRAGGGLGIFCHPYWFAGHRYDVPVALQDWLLERQPYDALEIIGGYFPHEIESNALQVARYHEERARGRRIPVVGVSDAHGCERGDLFGWYYTVVFAPSVALPDLVNSIKGLYSVAVEALPNQAARAFGPFRLVQYAAYLLREVFPRHDELCREEGRLMLAHAAGDPAAAPALASLSGRTARLYDHLWG